MKILHLSDIHFGTHQQPVLDALLGQITGELGPELIVLSGDMTQHATPRQFREARAFLDKLPKPLVVIPGNHDVPGLNNIPMRLGHALKRWEKWIAPHFPTRFRDNGVFVLGMNSVRAKGWYFDWSRGHLDDDQLAAVRREFRDSPETAPDGELRILTMHHPLIQPGHLPEFKRRVVDRLPQTLETFARARVDMVLSGHFHLGYADCLDFSDDWRGISINAASSISHRDKGQPNGFNIIQTHPQHVELQMFQWKEENRRFVPWIQRRFLCGEHGWAADEKNEEKVKSF